MSRPVAVGSGHLLSEDHRRLVAPALGTFAAGLIALSLFCSSAAPGTRATTAGVGVGVAAGSAAVGIVLGFLFGIPRSTQAESTAGPESAGYRPNTNLEQISDWLTKILVGVGLIQIGSAGDAARRLVHAVGEALGDTSSARILAAALLTLYLAWGFLTSYVVTRTWVTRTLWHSDLDLIAARAARLATVEVREVLDKRATADALALTLVDRILSPPPGTPAPSQDELDEAVAAASDTVRIQVFYRARQQRQVNWRSDKVRMGYTIPVFRALIAADVQERFHRNHAQLGFALKDKPEPDWRGADEALTEAIRRRGPAERGWLLYEFNRVICRVHLDTVTSGASQPTVQAAIREDIDALGRSPALQGQLVRVPEVARWLDRNGIRPSAGDAGSGARVATPG